MKKLILILFLFISGCNECSRYYTFQVNYIQDGELKYLYLNVKETDNLTFHVVTQEGITDCPDFIITEIFNYNAR